jgi:hypothetical protein
LTEKGDLDTLFHKGVERGSSGIGEPEAGVRAVSFQTLVLKVLMQSSRIPHIGFHALRVSCSLILAVAAAALALGGCTTAPPSSSQGANVAVANSVSIEDQVRDRATKRWEALIRGDLDSAYAFFSRATRDTYSIELYRGKMKPGMWREAKVESVKCEESVCEVVVVITVDHNRLRGIITPVTERWIVQDGVPWYVYNG